MSEHEKWRVTVEDDFGKRLLVGLYLTRQEAREAATTARLNSYRPRIRRAACISDERRRDD